MQKVFRNNQECPFGKSCIVDSLACRNCENYFGACGYLYIRCSAKEEDVKKTAEPKMERARKTAPKTAKTAPKRKPGRPKGSKKGPEKKKK